MAEDNKKALEMIQRLRTTIGKEPAVTAAPKINTVSKPAEDLKIPSLNDIEAPTQSVADMFAHMNRRGTRHSSGGVKADFTQVQATQPSDILRSTSDDLLAQMSPQQQENWQKLGNFIDNWVTENQAK